jgi:hypothetical protein
MPNVTRTQKTWRLMILAVAAFIFIQPTYMGCPGISGMTVGDSCELSQRVPYILLGVCWLVGIGVLLVVGRHKAHRPPADPFADSNLD